MTLTATLPPCPIEDVRASATEYFRTDDSIGSASIATIPVNAQWYSIETERKIMLINGRMIPISADTYECLEWEAQERGITAADLYEEDLHYQQLARQGAFSHEELEMLVETSTGDERLSEDDEESPF